MTAKLEKRDITTGTAICVPGNDIDTDRIIPARFMKCVTFDGLGQYAFYDVRHDQDGNALDHIAHVRAIVFADSAGAALATTGGSTGIAIGTDGLIADTAVAKKVFDLVSEPDGDIDLTWTDTGTEEVFLGLVMPNGKIVMSGSIQNAA